MWRRCLLPVLLAGLLALPAAAEAQGAPVEFSDSYAGYNSLSSCNLTRKIPGHEPAEPGRYPLFIYLHGWTGESAQEWRVLTQEAAAQGFVAAAPRYLSYYSLGSVDAQRRHADCLFNSSAGSALSKLCARPKVDCGRGVVVSGLSLGATIGALANDVTPLVRAEYLIGLWGPDQPYILPPPLGTRALPNNRLRIGIGRVDAPFSYGTMNRLTGRSCAYGNYNCLAADGSGYYVVQNREVRDGLADHCFHFYQGGCQGQQDPFDPGWAPPSELPWALRPSIRWLKGFTT